tara:strand:+ start:761323 stop:762105 length:783 start_codon:yes stop_codon:yes gene_type:complete
VIGQNSELSNNYNQLFYHYESAFTAINRTINATKACFNISNSSRLRAQVLYSTSYSVDAKDHIDQIIYLSKIIHNDTKQAGCSGAYYNSKYLQSSFESALKDLQLGALALISASELRNNRSIYQRMNDGIGFYQASLDDLNEGIENLNSTFDELQKCFEVEKVVLCEDVIDFIRENANTEDVILKSQLNSSWLSKVELFDYEDKYYVIAEIKTDDYGLGFKSYVFCNIIYPNWVEFKYGSSISYGEKFNEHIMDKKCNCK